MQTCSMKASQYTKKSDDNASDLEIGPQVQLAEFDFDEMGFNFAKKDASRFVGILKSKEDI